MCWQRVCSVLFLGAGLGVSFLGAPWLGVPLMTKGACQTACNMAAVSCYGAAGFVFGTVTVGAGTPAAILACNGALGTCMSACMIV
jgi:hypothetical protein